MDTEELDTLDFLAYLFLRNGKWDKALPLYEALVAVDGNNVRRKLALAYVMLRAGREKDAQTLLDWCLTQSDEAPSPSLVLLRARALWQLGRHEEAREFLLYPDRAAGSGW